VSSTVDGLVSGMNTTQVISQLMQVEAAPQDRLKDKVSTAQTAVASYQSVNSRINAFKTAADSLSQLSSWRSLTATSSSSTVTATATANLKSASGSLSFDVTSLASKQSTTMKVTTFADDNGDGTVDTTAHPITSATSITIQPGSYATDGTFTAVGDPKTIDISADQSASGIATAINNAGAGATAYVMPTSATDGVLQINSTKTGASNGFQISGLDGTGVGGTNPATNNPTSAVLSMSGGGGTTYTVASDTNTFSNLMAGVSITVSKIESGVTVDASTDVSGISDKFQALVDAANATLGEISNQTAYDTSTNTGSPLTGDFSVRNMSQSILSSISQGLSYPNPAYDSNQPESTTNSKNINFGSLKQLGVELNSTGQLTFDSERFKAAYNDNPAAIQKAGMALGDQFETMSTTMTTNLTSVITGRNNEIDGLNAQISDWDLRLSAKKQALQKQYSDLEVSLGKLKDQQTWLSGQLAGLS
jgi:flagellar hook-associated protein 2